MTVDPKPQSEVKTYKKEQVVAIFNKIESLRKKHEELMVHIDKLGASVQQRCPHPIKFLVKGKYISSSYFRGAQPPILVCRLCGYSENTWNVYHNKVFRKYSNKGKLDVIPELERNEAEKYVKRFR